MAIRIRILRPNFFTSSWYDSRIGQEFEVVDIHHGIPDKYEVDVTPLYERGELTVKRAYVPFCDAEVEDVPSGLPYPKPTTTCPVCAQTVATRPWLRAVVPLDVIEQHKPHGPSEGYCTGSNRSVRPTPQVI